MADQAPTPDTDDSVTPRRIDTAAPGTLAIRSYLAEYGRVIELAGELDLATRDQLADALTAALSDGAALLVLDLRALQFMDSTGLQTLLKADRRTNSRGKRLVIRNCQHQVERLLEITGVRDRLTFTR